MVFLELTRLSGKKHKFNVESIDHFGLHPIDGKTEVYVDGAPYAVKETPNDIEEMLKESYIFTKRVHGTTQSDS